MTFIGVGFGVITGSTLKTIALQQEEGKIILPNWLSFKAIPASSNLRLNITSTSLERKNSFNLALLFKNKEITEDDSRKGQDEIQKITDDYVSQIEEIVSIKEKEILEI